jgi:Ser/Thr protein kinase RdoA (MazF antagonist)
VRTPDTVIDAIVKWYSAQSRPDGGDTFVHGNMRLDNVLEAGKRVGFLDFEHCGSGPFCQDLARPITHLLQVGAIAAFPRWRVMRCLEAYLRGYGSVRPFDLSELDIYVGARMSRYYLETQNKDLFSSRIAGFPVPRSRLAALTTTVLSRGIKGAAPELSL